MTSLVLYEAARASLQAAHDVDEVKEIRDKAQAMAAYAKQAKDTKLVEWASEIKVRAERRAGAMLAEMKINGARHSGVAFIEECPEGTAEDAPTLETLGVSRKQSSKWQQLAAIPDDKFERAIGQTKQSAGMVTTAAVLRTTSPGRAAPPTPKPTAPAKPRVIVAEHKFEKLYEAVKAELVETKEALVEMKMLAESAKAFEEKDEFKQMQILRLELQGAKRRRDELMRENAEMKKQIAYWEKRALKAEKK